MILRESNIIKRRRLIENILERKRWKLLLFHVLALNNFLIFKEPTNLTIRNKTWISMKIHGYYYYLEK